ncbi:MAG: hypothetical protein HRT57_05350, partial [Crocinitomicaceae bacterium]|nr:hypothetical protein [Crocinitomicaceae bacterium]
MKFRFLLSDVTIDVVDQILEVSPVLFSNEYIQLNGSQFKLHIPGVATISALNGQSIQIQIIGKLDKINIELYLNGSVLGAILHQRGTLSFHGSSIESKGRGVLFCGDSGAGKST